ncbi:hypothetical protein T439DRAFT_346797 [Meredithblackwellia eburnea MCA 4105]
MDVASSGHSWFGIVSSAQEAHALIEASKQGLLPRVTRRLTDEERLRFIRPGAVFVWEEEEASVKRWTDHIKWSPSRVSGAFLTYTEIPSRGDETLIKQSFAATGTNNARMHLIAYTSKAAFATGALPTASRDPLVQRMIGQMTSNRDPRDPAPRPPPGPIASTSQRTPPPPLYSYLTHPSPTQKLPTKLSPTEPNHPSHLSQRFASSSSSAPPARNHSPPGSTRAGILSAGTERLSAPEPHHQIRHVSSYPSLRNILNQEHSESQTRPSPSPPLNNDSEWARLLTWVPSSPRALTLDVTSPPLPGSATIATGTISLVCFASTAFDSRVRDNLAWSFGLLSTVTVPDVLEWEYRRGKQLGTGS